ncbi:MAG: hypothetical protein ACJ763_17590 [Bdellovibrionia bacterium]
MAIYSIKKTSRFTKSAEDKAEHGISSSRRSKTTPRSAQQFSGVASRTDKNASNVSKRAKRNRVHEYKGPRRRPIE